MKYKFNDSSKFASSPTGIIHRLKNRWLSLWPELPPPAALVIFSALAALAAAIPLFYTIWQGIKAEFATWELLLDQRIPALLFSTLSLAAVVTAAGVSIGLILAWLVVRTDLPGRRFFRWALAIPLVFPTYVGALSYIMAFGPVGVIKNWLDLPFDIFSFPGVALVMTIFTYPYVFLITSSSLKRINPHLHESARSCGLSTLEVFKKVELPLLRPALGAGGYLIALYVLADFGAVSMLRFDTFATSIYFQMTGRYDREGAAVLSLVLIVITMTIVLLEYLSRKKNNLAGEVESEVMPPRIELGKWRWPAFTGVMLVFGAGVILPVGVLLNWLQAGLGQGISPGDIVPYVFNSLLSSGLAASAAMIISVPLVYLRVRYPGKLSGLINNLAATGYILPGVVVALGLIFFFNNFLPSLYGTLLVFLLALIIKYLPLSLQSSEASLQLVGKTVEDASRDMGVSGFNMMKKIVLPLAWPGVLAGAALVFVSGMKELTTALMLRPAGFDTLAVRVWLQASEGFYAEAALPALILVVVSVLPLKLLVDRF